MSSTRKTLTTDNAELVARYERIFAQAWLPRDIFGSDDRIIIHWPDTLKDICEVSVTMQHQSGRIYAQNTETLRPGITTIGLRKGLNAADGLYHAIIRPEASLYYAGVNIERAIPFYVINGQPSRAYYGDYENRREEALSHGAGNGPDVYSEIARLARGDQIRARIFTENFFDDLDTRSLLGLLFVVARYHQHLPLDLAASLNSALRRIDYTALGDGPSALACRMLAGVTFKQPDLPLAATLNWLHACAADGFDFFSPLDELIIVLVLLIEAVDEVAELAAIVLDKLLYTIALHPTEFSLDGRLSTLSGVTRLLWGRGIYNHHHSAYVMLACAQSYEVPSLIQAVAIDPGQDVLAFDRHRSGSSLIQRTVYRTPDYSLVSVHKRWIAELGHVHVFNIQDSPQLIVQEANVLQFLDSHIYWPTYAFSHWSIKGNWAFGCVDDAYVAIHASEEIQVVEDGPQRDRILCATTFPVVWTCLMGCKRDDGGFEEFVDRISSKQIPKLRPQALPATCHYKSAFSEVDFEQPTMDIRYKEHVMRLDLSSG